MKKQKGYYLIRLIIILVLSVPFWISNKFVNQIVTPKEFFFFFIVAALIILILFFLLKEKGPVSIQFTLPDILLLSYALYISISSGIIAPKSLVTPNLITSWMLLCWYFCLKWLIKKEYIAQSFVFTITTLIIFIESCWALLQYTGYSKSMHLNFVMTGSFENPGPLTAFIVLSIPIILIQILSPSKYTWQKYLSFVTFLIAITTLIVSNQRASWIGALVGIALSVFFLFREKIKLILKKKLLLLLSILLFTGLSVFAGIFLYQHKLESSKGRLIIWKNCLELVSNKPIVGYGYDNYIAPYSNQQAIYFQNHPDDYDSMLLAENIDFAFNEYLQITIETGVIGLLLFLLFIYSCLRKTLKYKDNLQLMGYLISVIAILVIAFITYPFHNVPVQAYLFLLLAFITSHTAKRNIFDIKLSKNTIKPIYICFALGIVYLIFIQKKRLAAQAQWKLISTEIKQNPDLNKIFRQYEDIYPDLEYDHYFLYNYGSELSVRERYKESIPILSSLTNTLNDSETYTFLGNSYEALGEFDSAEEAYRKSIYRKPNRFYPRYRLVKLWQKMGKKDEALDMAKTIIQFPVKVKSEIVDAILSEMRELCINEIVAQTEKQNSRLPIVLALSGQNLSELTKTIDHYSHEEPDSMKLKAALFLIENMEGHFFYQSDFIDIYKRTFFNVSDNQTERFIYWDSVKSSLKAGSNPQVVNDVEFVTSDYLISNIDQAFSTWEKVPWKNDYSFEQFCKYVLPHRSAFEPVEDWRAFFKKELEVIWIKICNGLPADTAYGLVYNLIEEEFIIADDFPYPFDLPTSFSYRGNVGTCKQMTITMVNAMRSLGIPASFDYVPAWANRAKGHDWPVFIGPDNRTRIILKTEAVPDIHYMCHSTKLSINDSILILPVEKTYPEISGLMKKNRYTFKMIDPDLLSKKTPVHTVKKVAKVYRQFYETNEEMLSYMIDQNDKYIQPFTDIHMSNVSDQYMRDPYSITLQLSPPPVPVKYVYIAVFNKDYMVYPIDKAAIEGNNLVTLHNLGTEILYFPVYVSNDQYFSAGPPFIIKKNKEVRYINISTSSTQTLKLDRKYPLFINIADHASKLYKGIIQGANTPDFSDAVALKVINSIPLYNNVLEINSGSSYQYIRFMYSTRIDISMAEFQAFGIDDTGNPVKLTGSNVGEAGDDNHPAKLAFDGKIETYFFKENTADKQWIGIDLGRRHEIKKVLICPRNDSNNILPGNTYELMVWNNGWNSAGQIEAADALLIYENIPVGTLYWLRCLSGGAEERPFTYENGVQVFW